MSRDNDINEYNAVTMTTLTVEEAQQLESLRDDPVVYKTVSAASQCIALKRPSSKRTYIQALNRAARLWGFPKPLTGPWYEQVPWHAVRRHHVVILLDMLRSAPMVDKKGKAVKEEGSNTKFKTLSYQTINVTLAAIKDVARQAFLLEQIHGDDLKRIEMLKSEKGTRKQSGRHVPSGEIRHVMESCERDPSPAGCRDAAIIGLLYVCGMRRNEVAELKMDNLTPAEGHIKIIGKGNKERHVWPDNGTWRAIEEWLAHRGRFEGPLFLPVNKGYKIQFGSGITDQAVYNVVLKRADQAALSKRVSPHDFRRSFITDLLLNDKDITLVSGLAGHSSVETTRIYDMRDILERRKAQEVMSLPYRGSIYSVRPDAPDEAE